MQIRFKMASAGVCLLALTAALACNQGETPQAETPAEHMQEHFAQVDAVRDALIAGDLAGSKEAADWLASHEVMDGIPEVWEQHVTQMQQAAATVVGAEDLATAAEATANMAGICGGCHMGLDEGAQFTVVVVPSEESGVVAHMLRHEWAADRMWEGLIGPSDDSWAAGAGALGEAALEPEGAPAEVGELAEQVHQLGAEALVTSGFTSRAALYGKLMITCAQCHQAMDAGPSAGADAGGEGH